MSALVLWINVPLMALAFALWVGVPLWLVLRHPDVHPKEDRRLPAYLMPRQRVTRTEQPVHAYAGHPGLASM
jgi:hypothetical protein